MSAHHLGGQGAIIGLVHIDLGVEQDLERKRHADGNEEPLDEACFGQRKVLGVSPGLFDTFQLEHDHDPKLVDARVILAHDPRLPQPPNVRHFIRQERLDLLVGHPGLHAIVGDNLHGRPPCGWDFSLPTKSFQSRPGPASTHPGLPCAPRGTCRLWLGRVGERTLGGQTAKFLSRPGSSIVVGLLADKWTIPVIHSLARGVKRTGELKRELAGVSQKMLTQTLRNLEDLGLVERKAYPVVPPRVEYWLTDLGESPNEPLAQICKWTESHGDVLKRAAAKRRARKGPVVHHLLS